MKRWRLKPFDPESARALEGGLGVGSLCARVLAARGYDDLAAARAFLSPRLDSLPNPLLIPGMEAAARRVADAVEGGERIWLYTDYDADGVTSAALLATFLSRLGANWRAWLPRRDREGYGLHEGPLREMAAQGGGLVVTADCGITASEPARVARDLGLSLVITDHHTPLPELPDAEAVVNPKLPGSLYPDQTIAGVGVAWNLACAIRAELARRGWFGGRAKTDERELLDFVALGTVADVVPLKGVNRVFVAKGIERLNSDLRPGLAALAKVAGLKGELTSGHLGFQLGPRINAAGRMEGPQEALNLLLAPDMASAAPSAARLDELNRERRGEEAATLKAAVSIVDSRGYHPGRYSLLVAGEGYHQGVVGIVASRLVERYYRPSIVLAVDGDTAKGSCRSIPGLDLYAALEECAHLLVRFGGHTGAAGLTVETRLIPDLREAFEEAVKGRLKMEELVPAVDADAEADPAELTLANARELERLAPFGYGNPTPLLLARRLRVRKAGRMGPTGEHLKLDLDCGAGKVEAVGWSMAERCSFIVAGTEIDLVGQLKVREWNSSGYAQLTLDDVRPARGAK